MSTFHAPAAFHAPDGTRLARRTVGDGEPLICLPGGPTDAGYLGDLGGLAGHRRLILLDPRGTGGSARPEEAASYRCDRQVGDAEARRHHAAGQPGNAEAVAGFAAEGAFDPAATRAALAGFARPVLLLAGEFDLNSPPAAVASGAELFPRGACVVQPGAGHYPWIDDPDRFVAAVAPFLG
ncbi:alpha/beta fold hydrolase [Streptomyces griseus]|uniref:alpha/beta fold hydrolase n=1 Tax=Streptomyces griseus TaxID=1911 RepID=UPI0033DAE291